MREVEKQIHGLWCSVASLFIPALKRIHKELIARANPRKVTSPGAIPNYNNSNNNNINSYKQNKKLLFRYNLFFLQIAKSYQKPPSNNVFLQMLNTVLLNNLWTSGFKLS